jgi:EAL domain-containing protein (putative c-di-GMP-specific phosphodiesterase class I)
LCANEPFLPFLQASLRGTGIAPRRLVLEIVEHASPVDADVLCWTLEALRTMGIRIALDDIGQGHSNFSMIFRCRPEIFKLDRYLVQGLPEDSARQTLVASACALAHDFGSVMVAEGIETAAQLAAVQDAGISLAQGFYLAEPRPVWQLPPCISAKPTQRSGHDLRRAALRTPVIRGRAAARHLSARP